VTLQLTQRGQQRPTEVALEPQMTDTSAHRRFEFDKRRCHTTSIVGGSFPGPESRRVGVDELCAQHVGNVFATLDRLDIPRERHQIAPDAVRNELGHHAVDVTRRQRRLEVGQPRLNAGLG